MAAPGKRERISDPECPIGRLNAEWQLLLTDVSSDLRVATWAATEAALHGFTSLAALDAAFDCCAGDESDALLLAVLRLRASGDELAGRLLLQRMLPQAVRVARSQLRSLGWHDACATAVCLLWEAISACPMQRQPRHVAANIALSTLRNAHRLRRRTTAGATDDKVRWLVPLDAAADVEMVSPWQPSAAQEVRDVISAAVAAEAISVVEAQLLRRVYLSRESEAVTAREIADELGISWDALRQRCSRSVRALSAAGVTGCPPVAA